MVWNLVNQPSTWRGVATPSPMIRVRVRLAQALAGPTVLRPKASASWRRRPTLSLKLARRRRSLRRRRLPRRRRVAGKCAIQPFWNRAEDANRQVGVGPGFMGRASA